MTENEKNIDKLSSLAADVIKIYERSELSIKHKETVPQRFQGLIENVNLHHTDPIKIQDYNDNDTGEVTAYDIYPCPPMWQLFKDTQENRELLVEQLENKTGKRFAFAEFDKPVREHKRDYADYDEELDLTQGNGRSR